MERCGALWLAVERCEGLGRRCRSATAAVCKKMNARHCGGVRRRSVWVVRPSCSRHAPVGAGVPREAVGAAAAGGRWCDVPRMGNQ